MDDLIRRQAAIDGIIKSCFGQANVVQAEAAAIQYIKRIPSAQPERKTGNWTRISIVKYTRHAQAWYRCSECQGEFIGKWNYCPNCGADMRGDQDGNQS